MMKSYTSVYIPVEGGVWALKDQQGKIFVPMNMPSELKQTDCRSKCRLQGNLDVVSLHQVGEIVRILSYNIKHL